MTTANILVAEDNASVLEAIAVMLESLGHTVARCRDGRSALNRLSKGERFGLLVTDVSMPRMSGLELLAAARQAQLAIPVVVMSGDPGNRPLALQAGALAFLNKPFRLGELKAAVAGALSNPRAAASFTEPGVHLPRRADPRRVAEILSDLYVLLGRIQSSPEAQRKSVYAACIHSLSELILLVQHPLPVRELLDLVREADRDLRSLAGLDCHARSESECQQRARASLNELSSRLAQHGVEVPLRPGSELQEVGTG